MKDTKVKEKAMDLSVDAEVIKPIQLNPELTKKYQASGIYTSQEGVDFVVYPNGRRGLQVTFEDGSVKYYLVSEDGSIEEMVEYKGSFYRKSWKRRFERLFGITDEMRYNKDPKIDLIHGIMFLVLVGIATGVVAGLAWVIRGLISYQGYV